MAEHSSNDGLVDVVRACWTDGIFLEHRVMWLIQEVLGSYGDEQIIKNLEFDFRKRVIAKVPKGTHLPYKGHQVEIDCAATFNLINGKQPPETVSLLVESKTARRVRNRRGFIACWQTSTGRGASCLYRAGDRLNDIQFDAHHTQASMKKLWFSGHARLFEPSRDTNKDSPKFLGKDSLWEALEQLSIGLCSYPPNLTNNISIPIIVTDLDIIVFNTEHEGNIGYTDIVELYHNVPAVVLDNIYIAGQRNCAPREIFLANVKFLSSFVRYILHGLTSTTPSHIGDFLACPQGENVKNPEVVQALQELWAER